MMNLQVPETVLPLGHAFLSTGAKPDWGLQHPLRKLGLRVRPLFYETDGVCHVHCNPGTATFKLLFLSDYSNFIDK